jgi:hypothetical protein
VANCSAPGACGAAAAAPAYCVGAALGRVLSLSTVVRYWTVETTRTQHLLNNESALHTVAACAAFRAAASAGWPGASVTWAFSWQALHAQDGEYPQIRALVAGYVAQYGDEFTFVPGGYFAPMYNSQEQTSADIHDALALISSDPMVVLVRADSPWRTLADLVKAARDKPGAINYSSSGNFGPIHLSVEMLAHQAGIKLTQVPFNGGGPSLLALLGGQVEMTTAAPAVALATTAAETLVTLGAL